MGGQYDRLLGISETDSTMSNMRISQSFCVLYCIVQSFSVFHLHNVYNKQMLKCVVNNIDLHNTVWYSYGIHLIVIIFTATLLRHIVSYI